MGFSKQEHWSGLPYPPPEYLPDLGIKSKSVMSPALAGDFFNTSAIWEAPVQLRPLWFSKIYPFMVLHTYASQAMLMVKNLPANAGDIRDMGLIPGLGKSPGVGNVTLFQYSCLENSMNRGASWTTAHGVVKSRK